MRFFICENGRDESCTISFTNALIANRKWLSRKHAVAKQRAGTLNARFAKMTFYAVALITVMIVAHWFASRA